MKKYFHAVILAFLIASQVFLPMSFSATMGLQIDMLLSQVRTNAGGSLSGGRVYFYAAGTSTPKDVYLDINKNTAAANPYTLDSNGTAYLFGDGLYRIVIKTAAGVTAYDRDNIRYEDLYSDLYNSSYNQTIRPMNITGNDNGGRIQGYTFGSAGFTDNAYFGAVQANDLITKGPWVDVRAFMSGATYVAWLLSPSTTNLASVYQAAADNNVRHLHHPAGYYLIEGSSVNWLDKYPYSILMTGAGVKSTTIHGKNINGPIFNFGGTIFDISDLNITSDNVVSTIWAYRRSGHTGGDSSTHRVIISGSASGPQIYQIAGEGYSYIDTAIVNTGAGGCLASGTTDFLSLSPSGYVVSSATFNRFSGGYMYTTGGGNVVEIYDGGDWTFDAQFYAGASSATKFRLHDTTYNIHILNGRFEGAGRMFHGSGTIHGLDFRGNSQQEAPTDYLGYMDNGSILLNANISGNLDYYTGGEYTYRIYDLQRSTINAPFANVSTWRTYKSLLWVWDIQYDTDLGGYYGRTNSSTVTTHNNNSTFGTQFMQFQAMSAPPYSGYGGFYLADATSNPAGLKNKLAVNVDRGDGVTDWFQIPVATTSVPDNTASRCSTGTFSFNSSTLYVCVADNTWKKATLSW